MRHRRRFAGALAALIVLALAGSAPGQPARPEGEMRWALYVTLTANWFDPGEVVGQLTPFWVLYALHDALVKPMPGNLLGPSLAELWTVSGDQRTYEFKLREGLKFHNGDAFTAEDVKFSFHRAKARALQERVRDVIVVDPHRVRFVLHEPWPDFLTYYGSLTSGAPDPAAGARARALRADLRVHLAERHRAARGRTRADADRPLSLVGAPRGRPPQALASRSRHVPAERRAGRGPCPQDTLSCGALPGHHGATRWVVGGFGDPQKIRSRGEGPHPTRRRAPMDS